MDVNRALSQQAMPPSVKNHRPLASSAQSFLTHLNLPHHPTHSGIDIEELSFVGPGVFELPRGNSKNSHSSTPHSNASFHEPPPPIGPISLLELHDDSYVELARTACTMTAPTLAMMELWLRLFALLVGPLCVVCLVTREIARLGGDHASGGDRSVRRADAIMIMAILAVASSAVLFTDSLYVYEYGRSFGCCLFVASSVLATRLAREFQQAADGSVRCDKNHKRRMKQRANCFSALVWGLLFTTMIVFLRSDGGHMINLALEKVPTISILSGVASTATTAMKRHDNNPLTVISDPGIDLPTIEPGFYHSSNPLIQSIAKHWPESSRSYNVSNGATPYLVNGDQRTGIPFLVNKVEEQEYVRVYVQNPFDKEYLALDIAFPFQITREKGKEWTKTIYKIHDPLYITSINQFILSYMDSTVDLTKNMSKTLYLVVDPRAAPSLGMMDTTMIGWNVFHGARTGDVDIAARAVKRGLVEMAREMGVRTPILAGVGYSMGAIILSNYVARSGSHCALDSAIAISGGLDMRQQLNFKRSMRLWQPMLTFGLREDILLGKYARHYKHRLTKEQFRSMLRVTSISHLDVEAIVNYNSFDDLVHYYSEMSAMGDRDPEFQLFDDKNEGTCNTDKDGFWGRIANVSIPFVVLQALDDPLVGWRTIGTANAQGLAESGSGNIILLLTKAGGHVGWPVGTNPKKEGWKWMNDAARDFVLAVAAANQDLCMKKRSKENIVDR
ncbi:hypothetical protein HJC23_005886 [Cyclotella cryptica]|uniref:Uncharacterized protein n=1 Tax=Cyclotella cryptica TaxID=29204 RepID=A0ABD3QZX9_9STRA